MYRLLKKNLNIFLLLFLMNVSYLGLKDFTRLESNQTLETELTSEEKKSNFSKNNDSNNKFLIKKQYKDPVNNSNNEDLKIANYSNSDFFSDYNFSEMDLDLSLVPVSDKILFSGIPIPKSKPLPLIKEFSKHISYSVKSKKGLLIILENNKFDLYQKQKIYELIIPDINFKVEDNLKFSFSVINGSETLSEITIFKNSLHEIRARRNEYGNFISQYVTAPTQRKIIRHRITVYNNISSSLQNTKIPKVIIDSFINQFSFSVDFQRDINDGDLIELLYEANFTKNNNLVGSPQLLYSAMNLSDQNIELFRYKLRQGQVDFFDPKGKSIRKSIMRTPISGARLSSRFGMRKHPILGYSKMHRGVDFAARRGTPIMAAGDGRVTFAGRNGSYGKFIEIRHLNGFSTRYGHLHKFGKKIKKGTIVKQGETIGFVGNSGRSTGPHLHYEVKHKNRIINPMTLKLPSRMEISEKEMPNFYANISLTRERLATTPVINTNRFVVK